MVKVIDRNIIEETSERAKCSDRQRMNHNFHQLTDRIQRLLNAIEPGSYIRPHRHSNPDKTEIFLILGGMGAVVIFDEQGDIREIHCLDADGDKLGVEIPPGIWHTVLSLREGTVFFEVKDGPYIETMDKDFANWAPSPKDARAAKRYMQNLMTAVKRDIEENEVNSDRQEALK